MKKALQKVRSLRGSILAYTLIVLFLLIATAIGIAGVAVVERKGAFSTDKSVQSLQVANTGVERILAQIQTAGSGDKINTVFPGCSNNRISDDTGRGEYEAILIDSNGDEIKCSDYGNFEISKINEVKSIGHFSGNTRAVQVAVADTDHPGIGTCYDPSDMMYIQAMSSCPDPSGSADSTHWRICNLGEIEDAMKKGCMPILSQYGWRQSMYKAGSNGLFMTIKDGVGTATLYASEGSAIGTWQIILSNSAGIYDACCRRGN